MYKDPNVLIALLGTVAAMLLSVGYYILIIKRKTTMSSSLDDDQADVNDQTSSSDVSIADLPDGENYDVFLSFRGKETRKDFADHLYQRLVNAGVWAFRDNEALHVGDEIGPELDKAIRASKISIPIISSDYASSEWCLRELVQILKCKKTGRVVLPIFYRVDPSSVRHRTGTFEKAFHLHEKKYGSNSMVVQDWKNALAEVASLKGWESSKIANGHEARLVEIVVTKVLNELRKATLIVTDCLVGIEYHKENILKMVQGKESTDAQAIVIHGMGGAGKTTLAKVIYNQLFPSFQHCCYLPNIRETLSEQKCRPEELQNQLISNIIGQQWPDKISHVDEGINIIKDRLKDKKVLILFDDVDCTEQLNALARERSWFKSGSILIITTRNKDVLKKWKERLTYELNELDRSLSFLLFCKHAFGRDECPLMEFHAIAHNIVCTTGGLPLAIEIIGSMLFGKSKVYWEGVLKKLQKIPHKDVQKKLKITYDALEHEQQQIFLDIACLSSQMEIDFAFYMWDDCGFFPKEGIDKLISLSLIKMGGSNQIIIHDQLRDLGRAIVREEDYKKLGNRSRLWDEEEALEVMRRNQATARIEALNLSIDNENSKEACCFSSEQFKELTRLRFLQLNTANLVGDFKNLLLDLRWFRWKDCPSIFLATNFCPTKLMVLDLSYSDITEHWNGWAQMKLVKKLKVLNLQGCSYLTSTPDFSTFEKLEILILRDCRRLRRIHRSIGSLNKTLLTLDVRDCHELDDLPNEMGEMQELLQLLVDRTSIKTIPISKGCMTKLKNLVFTYCQSLQYLPDSMGSLQSLVLEVRFCDSLEKLPDITLLTNLEVVHVIKCEKLTEIKGLKEHKNLKELEVICCNSLDKLPDISLFTSLEKLHVDKCDKLKEIMVLKEQKNLKKLHVVYCDSLVKFPDISLFTDLKEVHFRGCEKLAEIKCFKEQKNLKRLKVSCCNSLEQMPNISLFTSLEEVHVSICEKLLEIKALQRQKNLKEMKISHCRSLDKLPDISLFTSLEEVHVNRCEKLREIKALQRQKNLKELKISHCGSLEKLSDISLFTSLKEVHVNKCEKLMEIKGFHGQENLEKLQVSFCKSLDKLPDISLFTSLQEVYIIGCQKLIEIKGLRGQNALKIIKIYCCDSLDKLPDFSLFPNLTCLVVIGCEKLTEIKEYRCLLSP